MSYYEEIYTYNHLNSLITNKVIRKSFWVNSTSICELLGVKKIITKDYGTVHFKNLENIGELEYVDCDFSFWGNLKTLGKLKYVGGEFRFGAPINSLGELKEVGGDLRPRSSELMDLGKLQKVGGTADFRGMIHLKSLGNLKEVGENLNLVKSLKGHYDLSNIKVGGRIIYWKKEPIYFVVNKKSDKIDVPVWEDRSSYEFENNLVFPNKSQLDFYNRFKKNFEKGIYLDLGGMKNYLRYYVYCLFREYEKNKNFIALANKYQTIREEYPEYSFDTDKIEVETGRKLGIKKHIDYVFPHEEYIIWGNMLKSKLKKVDPLIKNPNEDGLLEILKLGFKKEFLTIFGLENLETIIEKIVKIIRKIEQDEDEAFARRFFDKGKFYKITRDSKKFDPSYYKMFFETEELFNEKMAEHNKRNLEVPLQNKDFPVYYPNILIFAIENYIKELTREAENEIRFERNLPKVGEGWINETNLFYKIKSTFSDEKVIQHGRTKWLGLQHFDIYFPELLIAIEYQGKQHSEVVEFFGGVDSFIQGVENDRIKKEKCKKYDCVLIEVFPDYNYEDIKSQIKKAIVIKKTGQ